MLQPGQISMRQLDCDLRLLSRERESNEADQKSERVHDQSLMSESSLKKAYNIGRTRFFQHSLGLAGSSYLQ